MVIGELDTEDSRLICTACGTQYDASSVEELKSCHICDDPRQFVPPSGQAWTSLKAMQGTYKNKTKVDPDDDRIISIWTEPKFAIGQRAFLLRTGHGNVLWDLITHLDEETIDYITSLGGIHAIVISHPHYYTTHGVWAKAFDCPVYLSLEDQQWLSCADSTGSRVAIASSATQVAKGVTAIKVGGHFDGSLVLHWGKRLFVADSIVTVPSALYHIDRSPGTSSFSFMWSIPNMIPLSPEKVMGIWKALEIYDFTTTHGAFNGMDVHDEKLKERVLESAKIFVKAMGYRDHPILLETWEG